MFARKTSRPIHRKCNFKLNSYTFICEPCNQLWPDEEHFKHHMEQKHNEHVCVSGPMQSFGRKGKIKCTLQNEAKSI